MLAIAKLLQIDVRHPALMILAASLATANGLWAARQTRYGDGSPWKWPRNYCVGTYLRRPWRYRYNVLGLLQSASLLTYLDRVCISVAGPRIQDELHLSAQGWGLVTGAFALAYALFEIPGGYLADHLVRESQQSLCPSNHRLSGHLWRQERPGMERPSLQEC